jgi:hypothetical protein
VEKQLLQHLHNWPYICIKVLIKPKTMKKIFAIAILAIGFTAVAQAQTNATTTSESKTTVDGGTAASTNDPAAVKPAEHKGCSGQTAKTCSKSAEGKSCCKAKTGTATASTEKKSCCKKAEGSTCNKGAEASANTEKKSCGTGCTKPCCKKSEK